MAKSVVQRALAWTTGRAWPAIRKVPSRWSRDEGTLLSAAMAYYAAFSLFPLCLVLVAGLGLLTRIAPGMRDAKGQLLAVVDRNVSPWLSQQLDSLLQGIELKAVLGGPLGILGLLVAALAIFMQLDNQFDRIWSDGNRRRSYGWTHAVREAFFARLFAFSMLLAAGALLALIFIADIALAGVRPYIAELPAGRAAWNLLQTGITVAGNALLMAVIYKVIPRAEVAWSDALAGGLVVAVIWAIGQRILTGWIIGEKYSAYGVVGTFIALMLWFYYASMVVFLGAEFTRALCEHCESEVDAKRPR